MTIQTSAGPLDDNEYEKTREAWISGHPRYQAVRDKRDELDIRVVDGHGGESPQEFVTRNQDLGREIIAVRDEIARVRVELAQEFDAGVKV